MRWQYKTIIQERVICYAVVVQVIPGDPSTGYVGKEYPQHFKTPKFNEKVNYVMDKQIWYLNDRTFWL